jgi:hypothetical protein
VVEGDGADQQLDRAGPERKPLGNPHHGSDPVASCGNQRHPRGGIDAGQPGGRVGLGQPLQQPSGPAANVQDGARLGYGLVGHATTCAWTGPKKARCSQLRSYRSDHASKRAMSRWCWSLRLVMLWSS